MLMRWLTWVSALCTCHKFFFLSTVCRMMTDNYMTLHTGMTSFRGRVYFRHGCKKCALKHWLCHDQHAHWSAQFNHEILYRLGMCMGWFMCMLSLILSLPMSQDKFYMIKWDGINTRQIANRLSKNREDSTAKDDTIVFIDNCNDP